MIELNNVTIELREPILQNANYNFQTGRIYLLHALNGSGKTSVLRAIVSLIKPNQGNILFSGQTFDKVKQEVFYFETSDWFDNNLSGLDYLKFIKRQWNSNNQIDKEIDRWKMNDYVRLPIKKYSLGMKQKLLISMYSLSNAKYLLMDEINNGLDESSRAILYEELVHLADQGKLVILASHYQSEIGNIIDQALTIKDGKLIDIAPHN
ncbi:ABC transporter ATP-binding protein [Lactobacillus sp. ESL0684]|uniref:ATP-binding cassette domain-containing protein n=1 Tax=Lactobacillus sp. ESL0684 TaxID=2983213 RepID=UPI0023FA3DDE|nr:ABC transporter ATP-binding protein [Lactobacillus sp. ESL0684]WEV43084.1 ABC transporter ATP-binding protein [Lactobacillus sp. ESL0684]